jgi:hypothetical protein
MYAINTRKYITKKYSIAKTSNNNKWSELNSEKGLSDEEKLAFKEAFTLFDKGTFLNL